MKAACAPLPFSLQLLASVTISQYTTLPRSRSSYYHSHPLPLSPLTPKYILTLQYPSAPTIPPSKFFMHKTLKIDHKMMKMSQKSVKINEKPMKNQ